MGITISTTDFYPRPPGGGRQLEQIEVLANEIISIHALRVEGDEHGCMRFKDLQAFLSTPSGWRATPNTLQASFWTHTFLSTPSGWRATYELTFECTNYDISIHALRVEGDLSPCDVPLSAVCISIHALRVEGDSAKITPPLMRF